MCNSVDRGVFFYLCLPHPESTLPDREIKKVPRRLRHDTSVLRVRRVDPGQNVAPPPSLEET